MVLHAGQHGQVYKTPMTAIPGMDTAAYAAKDALGTLITFDPVPESGIIMGVNVVDRDQELLEFDIVLFETAVVTGTNNAIYAPTDAELSNLIGVITVTNADYSDFSTNAVASVMNLGMPYVLKATTSLYAQCVARGAPNLTAATDYLVQLVILAD